MLCTSAGFYPTFIIFGGMKQLQSVIDALICVSRSLKPLRQIFKLSSFQVSEGFVEVCSGMT